MADGFSGRVLFEGALKDLRDLDRRQEKATMWGLREAGRQTKREAMKRAPVYGGKQATAKSRKQESALRTYGQGAQIIPGELKNSIKSSKRLKRIGRGAFSLKVGPRGDHVHLYAPKQEARVHFMAQAKDAVEPKARAIFERAWDRVNRSARGR